MPNRYHLTDYTAAEIRALPAGPLLDWLALQGLHGVSEARKYAGKHGVREARYITDQTRTEWHSIWWSDIPFPTISTPYDDRVSTSPGAAMRALLALAEAMAIDAVMLQVWFKDDEWELDAAKANGGGCSMREGGPNFPTLIAQACALWGLHKAKEPKP